MLMMDTGHFAISLTILGLIIGETASGVGSDDWMNKNVKVTLEFNK